MHFASSAAPQEDDEDDEKKPLHWPRINENHRAKLVADEISLFGRFPSGGGEGDGTGRDRTGRL